MGSQTVDIVAVPATGGLYAPGPDIAGQPGQWADLTNFDYLPSGTLRKRKGVSRLNGSSTIKADTAVADVVALADFNRYAISSGVLTKSAAQVAIGATSTDTSIYYSSGSSGATWTALDDTWGTTGSLKGTICIADGFAVFANGVDAPQKWDQTTFSALGASAPAAGGFSYHLRRLFSVAEASGDGSTVKFCAASDITDWTGSDTGSFVLDENDGDYVAGASKPFRGNLYFFKGPNEGAVFELSGQTPSTFQRRRIATGAPTNHHSSIVTTPYDIFWASGRGIHSLRALETRGNSLISLGVQRILDLFSTSGPQYGYHDTLKRCVGWLGLVNGTGTAASIEYYYMLDKWAYHTFTLGAGTTPVVSAAMVGNQLWLGGGIGYVYGWTRFTTGSNNDIKADGTAATFTVTATPPVFYSIPQEVQRLSVGIVGRARTSDASITATVLQDVDTSGTEYTITLPNSSDSRLSFHAEVPVEGVGRWIRAVFTETSANHLEIHGYYFQGAPGGNLQYTPSGSS